MIATDARDRRPPGGGRRDVLVVGAGITGLACAHALHQAGVDALVLESRERVGGCIESVERDGYLFECGPHTIRGVDPDLIAHLRELGIGEGILDLGRTGGRRFIVRDGRIAALPSSLFSFLTSDFLSRLGKLRLLREPFVGPSDEERPSLGDFVEHRLGAEVRHGALDAFVGGIWAGDPDRISAHAAVPDLVEGVSRHGSLFRYALARRKGASRAGGASAREAEEPTPKIFGLRGGLGTWPAAIARSLGSRVRTGTTVCSLDLEGEDAWSVGFEGPEGAGRAHARHVVITGGPASAARLAGPHLSPDTATRLEGLRAASLTVVHLGYGRDAVQSPPEGFGVLVPRNERRRCLGILFASSLLPDRAPSDALCTTTFFGGVRDPEVLALDDDGLVDLAHREHADLLGFSAAPRVTHVRRWSGAIPQYELGHGRLVSGLEEQEARVPGLHLAGRYRGGVSVPDCWRRGRDLGRRLAVAVRSAPGGALTTHASRGETAAAAPVTRSRP